MPKPGIAVITYKRPQHLASLLDAIRRHTHKPYELVISSDSENDEESRHNAESRRALYVCGPNRGAVWNRNRGLYYLMEHTNCDPLIMIEDDTQPADDGWLGEWVDAASRWHHLIHSFPNLLAAPPGPLQGSGTPADPYVTVMGTSHCVVSSRHAMNVTGYLDQRFVGYGYGHAEWSFRQSKFFHDQRMGHGHNHFYLCIDGGLRIIGSVTTKDKAQVAHNKAMFQVVMAEKPSFRPAWSNDDERAAVEQQIRRAMAARD